jgi:two-component system nitrogen regulation sensor histidine kinase NtrY
MFLFVAMAVALTVALVTWTVSASARHAFELLDAQRTAMLISQFRREFARESEEVAHRVERIASTDTLRRTTLDLAAARADRAVFVNEAAPLAAAYGLDFLDLVSGDGTIVSSAHWPARFGYKHPWAGGDSQRGAIPPGAFLQAVELPRETALGLMAIQEVVVGERRIYLVGGRRLDQAFLQSLVLPAGMRVLLSRNLPPAGSGPQLIEASGNVTQAGQLGPLIARVRRLREEATETIGASDGPETVDAIPLAGRDGTVLGVLLVTSSGRELAALVGRIRWSGVAFGSLGILFGFVLSYAVAARVTHPVERLADAAKAVASGAWDTRVTETHATGEIEALASAFDTMTRQLVDHRDRLVQAERVAAWRDLARRLAHELKNPLFPLRISVDNLRRARTLSATDFNEVVDESLETLSAGLASLSAVIARFSDFAKMPAPHFERVLPNDIVRGTLSLLRAQLDAPGRPPIEVTVDLDPALGSIRADPDQLARALQNLLLNAIEAMPGGGELTIRTRGSNGSVRLDVSDTGEGLTEDERKCLFTPYYTTKLNGTGLGLAIVQSVVADHTGRIWVESERGRGTTFYIELPGDIH